MKRLFLLLIFAVVRLCSFGQADGGAVLKRYIDAAKKNSPMIADFRNQAEIHTAELQRLRALYTHSRLELNGDYLFVPVVSTKGGGSGFKWNAQSANDYYGYDLGESSGHLHAGATWTKPLLGGSSYNVAQTQAAINNDIASNHIRMEQHQLERTVTEQYLLCLLDKEQIAFTDSVAELLKQRTSIVRKLTVNGMAKQSDVELLMIERDANLDQNTALRQSYHTHLMELNLLCGIADTATVNLPGVILEPCSGLLDGPSRFTEQYRLDSLNTSVSLLSFKLQYRPQLDLFVNGGMQTGDFAGWYRHFGVSAGLTFRWILADGKQKHWVERQTILRQNTIKTYRDNAEYQRRMRISQCIEELGMFDKRETTLRRQIAGYDTVLSNYGKEVNAGQVSVLDYITVLRNKVQTENDLLLLRTNRQLVIAALNYWKW